MSMTIDEYKGAIKELSQYPMDVLQQLVLEAQEDGDYLILSNLYYVMYLKTKTKTKGTEE